MIAKTNEEYKVDEEPYTLKRKLSLGGPSERKRREPIIEISSVEEDGKKGEDENQTIVDIS